MKSLITSAVLTSVALLAAACTGSSGSSAASGASSAPASSASPGPASSSPGTPASPAAPAAGASSSPAAVSVAGSWSGYGPCPDLQVRLGLAQATTTVTYQVIDFINRSGRLCFLDGVPGVNLAGGTPVAPVGLPARQDVLAKARRITLPAGAVANALLQITNARGYSSSQCGPVQALYLIIYLPNDANPVKVPYGTTACSRPVQMMQVSAVSFGTGG